MIADYKGQPLIASNFKHQWEINGDEIDGEDDIEDDEDVNIVEEFPPPPSMLAIEDGVINTTEELGAFDQEIEEMKKT